MQDVAPGRLPPGTEVREAAREAARPLFRPILLTSFAFILGSLPPGLRLGRGAASRHSMGQGERLRATTA
jgi:multidrug efflux pump